MELTHPVVDVCIVCSNFEESLELALVAQEQVRKTEDHKEAVQAFLEKRPADLKGR